MRRSVVALLVATAMVGLLGCSRAASTREQQLAAEGRGLLAQPVRTTGSLGGIASPHPFTRDPSGGLSRTLFETDEHPNFRVIVKDFSFPPGGAPNRFTLRSAAVIQLLGDHGKITIGNERRALTNGETLAVSAGTPIDVVNDGAQHVVVRAVIVEAK